MASLRSSGPVEPRGVGLDRMASASRLKDPAKVEEVSCRTNLTQFEISRRLLISSLLLVPQERMGTAGIHSTLPPNAFATLLPL